MSSENIVKRLEELLSAPCVEQKQAQEHAASTTTCTKQRQLRKIQPELIHASMRDHINARIAQTETADGTTNPSVQNSRTGRNQTIMHLRCLAASIYFWSPHVAWGKEERKSKFMHCRLQGQSFIFDNNADRTSTYRKESFVNFPQAALTMMASNPQTPITTLKWLAVHDSAEVRKSVAQNENTDDETLSLLTKDPDDNVKIAALENVRMTKDLAADSTYDKRCDNSPLLGKDWHIRMLIAGDPNVNDEILWQLANRPVSQAKRKLVDSHSCLLETVIDLKGQNNPTGNHEFAASTTQTTLKDFAN